MFLKKLKIGARLGFSFGVLLVMLLGLSIFAVIYLNQLSRYTADLYNHPFAVATAAERIDGNIVKMHRSMKDVALALNEQEIQAASNQVDLYEIEVYKDFEIIKEKFLGDKATIIETEKEFRSWKVIRDEVIGLMETGNRAAAAAITKGKGADHIAALFKDLNDFETFAYNMARTFFTNAQNDAVFIIIFSIILAVIALVVGIVLAILVTRSITDPLMKIVTVGKRITRGDFPDSSLNIESRDEVGAVSAVFNKIVEVFKAKGRELEKIADGDLTVEVQFASEKDQFARAFKKMVVSLNGVLSQVNVSVDQMAFGSDQVARSSQSLSQGATEQASSLEEISSSINEISSQSRQNADNAIEANSLSKSAMEYAEDGNKQMAELISAMEKINSSSDEIKKVVKVIDDIAFQINLLALNANVEAARAGKYGKGFAVVAEEVRNLAVKSAQSVKETTGMVEVSIKNIELGNSAAQATADQLKSIVTGSGKVADLVEEIASASKEQAQGIDQINSGLSQIDNVTQANTASAEESASAAEQLASQGRQLKAMISKFNLKQAGKAAGNELLSSLPGDLVQQLVQKELARLKQEENAKVVIHSGPNQKPEGETGITVVDPEEVIKLDDDNFGKF